MVNYFLSTDGIDDRIVAPTPTGTKYIRFKIKRNSADVAGYLLDMRSGTKNIAVYCANSASSGYNGFQIDGVDQTVGTSNFVAVPSDHVADILITLTNATTITGDITVASRFSTTNTTGVDWTQAEVHDIITYDTGMNILQSFDWTTGNGTTLFSTTGAGSGTITGALWVEDTGGTPSGTTYTASGTIQGTSTVSSVENSILKALGTLQGSSSLMSSETYTTQTGTTYTGGGTLQGISNVSGNEHYFYKANGTLQGSSNVSGNEHYLYKAIGTLQGFSSLSSGETLTLFTGNTYSASGTIQGFSTLSASEKIIYKEISTAVGYSDSSVHEIVTLLASGIAQGYSNVLLIDQTEVIAQVSLIGKQRIEVTLVGKQKIDTIMQGKQRISINLKGVMK